ncbi:50S ribosomal protein L10 [Ignatzschineria sp. RMDPL8A]|uniref:50S ribosomal protein L10 n=1 Tax=Ignatzschineria sp. RMDPL8A TaxID=2999236 RepID=UPI0016A74EAF|nr:50S ribosomal protein L10 [Ignatzschineria sp. RMDPL8A]MDG9729326.1 50S ribosomal protein L10 [Ignatzschineria sp. RMDPL8A]NLD09134.1 50S ribosomal protein L10 [Xanthomonadaceae bacterium]
MSVTLQDKQVVVAEVNEIASQAHALVLSEYHGLTVAQMTLLRNEARAAKVDIRVVKNTLARRALEGTAYECAIDSLVGPIVMAFSLDEEDPVASARVINNFLKDKANEKLVVKAIVHDGELHDGSALKAIASLPTKEEAISLLLAVLKAPVQKLAATLAAVRDQKEAA